jgi:hypothetical protein
MKKIVVLCIVLAAGLTSGSFLYASKSGKSILNERQFRDRQVVKCKKQVDLIPSLFFF